MATLYIEEYRSLMAEGSPSADIPTASGEVPVGLESVKAKLAIPIPGTVVAKQKVTVAASSAQSAAFNADTRFVILITDTACQVEFGSAPTADGDSHYLPVDVPREFLVTPAEKVAVIEQQ